MELSSLVCTLFFSSLYPLFLTIFWSVGYLVWVGRLDWNVPKGKRCQSLWRWIISSWTEEELVILGPGFFYIYSSAFVHLKNWVSQLVRLLTGLIVCWVGYLVWRAFERRTQCFWLSMQFWNISDNRDVNSEDKPFLWRTKALEMDPSVETHPPITLPLVLNPWPLHACDDTWPSSWGKIMLGERLRWWEWF